MFIYVVNIFLSLGYIFFATYAATDVWNLVLFPITGFQTNYLQALGIVAFIGIIKRADMSVTKDPVKNLVVIITSYIMVSLFWSLAYLVT